MSRLIRERPLVFALAAAYGLFALILLASLTAGWWSGSEPEARLVPIEGGGEPGLDGPALTSSGSLAIVTATVAPPTETPAPALAPPTEVPPTAPPPAPTQASPLPPGAPPHEAADFSGRWRIFDTVTEGANTGQTYSFDVTLFQQGNQLIGGNSGIEMAGVVDGDTATLTYLQPALGYTGTFVWTLAGPDAAEGIFTSSVPNSGVSVLQRLP